MTADISGYVREHLHQTGGFAIQTWGLPWIIHDESVVLPISIPNVVAWKYCCHENCHQMRFTLHFLKLDVCVLWLNYLNSLFCCWPKHMSSPLSMAKFRDSLGTCHQVCRLLRPWSAPPGLFLRLLNTSRYRTDLKLKGKSKFSCSGAENGWKKWAATEATKVSGQNLPEKGLRGCYLPIV